MMFRLLPIGLLAVVCALPAEGQVIINELMYHPASQTPREEYIELHNRASTNVNVSNWRISRGVDYVIPNGTTITAGGYLVIAGHRPTFQAKYPGVSPVIGDFVQMITHEYPDRTLTNWDNTLSNSRNGVDLLDADGDEIDSVEYADEGDWAVRRRGLPNFNHRGWVWWSAADGNGSSLELINPGLPNDQAQCWAASATLEGTPGAVNSVFAANIAPRILNARHFPPVPTSSDSVTITARIEDEQSTGLQVTLFYRVASINPPGSFVNLTMFDDGAHGDGAAGDGLYATTVPAQPNGTVIDFYVQAQDAQANVRTWPAGALPALDQPAAPPVQEANALYQVDDDPQNRYGTLPSLQPVYKMIMTEAERAELINNIIGGDRNSDAQMNTTFISLDGTETLVQYLCGSRNRGHGSRGAGNFRVNFRADDRWKGVTALNLNIVSPHIQHVGSVLALKAGAVGTQSRAVQLRVNNFNRTSGSYAANEVYNGEWGDRHFPNDGGGNIYKAVRDLPPSPNPFFDYRGEDSAQYARTYDKQSNAAENDWEDIKGMLAVMGDNAVLPFEDSNIRAVINPEQWLRHLAVMNLMGNNESGLNTGNNDDYYMYRGVQDPRFILLFHDLDQILGVQSMGVNGDIFRFANCCPISGDPSTSGTWQAMDRFVRGAGYTNAYYQILQELLNTTFSQPQFDAVVDETLGPYIASTTRDNIKNWMNQRRSFVQGVIAPFITSSVTPPRATITGVPRVRSPLRNVTLTVGGVGITHYRYRLNNTVFQPVAPVSQPIQLNNLPQGSTNFVVVVGMTNTTTFNPSLGIMSATWVVDTNTPSIRLNEVLARNDAAYNHEGDFPDIVELYNEGSNTVDISGMRLTDDPTDPHKFAFPPGTTVIGGGYLLAFADNETTSGIHLGYNLRQEGAALYLYDTPANGGGLVDSVQFGLQAADLSIGRVGSESAWVLGQPTIGGANIAVTLGATSGLKINEWLAAGTSPFADDFLEIYNPDPSPVSIAGLFLTDNRIGAPMQTRIPDLSFMVGRGQMAFIADGTSADADHVNFQLASEQGEIYLLSSSLQVIDCVSYGPQRLNVPVGRCPDGGPITTLPQATPALPNACPGPPPGATTNNIFVVNSTWRYNTNSVPANWKDRTFSDTSWASGNAVLYGGSRAGSIPDTIRTALPQPPTPGSVTFVPLGHTWRYNTAGVEFSGWNQMVFDDSGWSNGAALLYNGTRPQNVSIIEPIRTTLPPAPGRPIAYYYRAQFSIAPGTIITSLQLDHAVDDSAVFYLNGNEVGRFNLPLTGPIVSNTPANGPITDAQLQSTNISVSNVMVGLNVLAVETHQTVIGNADVCMGARLTAVVSNDARNTYYFRQRFTLPADFAATQLQISHLIDDGAVFYLNGAEIGRFNMPTGIVTDTTLPITRIADATYQILTIPANGLLPGDNVFAVQVHQRDTSDSDVCLGIRLDAITATNGAGGSGIVISEVFANNATTFIETNITPTGTNISTPDLIELYNPSNGGVDLSNCSLTDDPAIPRRWVFPPGSIIVPRGYMIVKFDSDAPASTNLTGIPNTGFGLSADGEPLGLYLINSPGGGGGVLDSIVFGIQTADYSVSRVPNTSSNWTLTLPTLGATNNLPVSLGNPLNLKVNEWMANPVSGEDDWFEIYNPNPQPVALGGLYLTDVADTPNKHQITQLSFIGFGSNAWQRFWADRNLTAGADHVDFRLSASEEDVGLFTAFPHSQINVIHFVGQQIGISEGRLPDGGENRLKFPGTASPGDPNYAALTNIVINEVLAHSDPPLEDAIELRNLTASPINVGGWWLSDAKRTPKKYRLPNRTIPGNGFTVFYEYEFNNVDNTPTPFSLSSASGDEVYLSAATNNGVDLTGYRAVADFGPSANAVSMGPYRNSQGVEEFVALSQMTFGGGTNSIEAFRGGMGQANTYPKVGPIVITEVMYHPPDIGTNDNVVEEFIELYNAGSATVPLYDVARPTNRWRLRDAVDFDFPANRSIPPGGYLLVVSFDPLSNPGALASFQTRYGSNSALVGPYQGKLDNSSDSVEIYKPDPPQTIFGPDFGSVPYILVEKVVYGDRAPWPTNADGGGQSLQRRFNDGYANDVTNWVAATPSPGPAGAGDTDRDHDGMPNDWEEAYDLNPDNPNDWDDDADQDGVINLREYLAGTDPTDPDSYLAVESVSVTGSTVAISFTAVAGKTYTLQYRNSLSAGDWATLQDVPAPPSTGVITIYDNTGASPAQRYYRLVTPQQ